MLKALLDILALVGLVIGAVNLFRSAWTISDLPKYKSGWGGVLILLAMLLVYGVLTWWGLNHFHLPPLQY
jgi:amino acid permease